MISLIKQPCTAVCCDCRCVNKGCTGTHVCGCGGSWRGVVDTDSFELVLWPGGMAPSVNPLSDVLRTMLRG